jgi:hypothetical protein
MNAKEEYDPATETWKTKSLFEWSYGAPSPFSPA